MIYLRRKNNNIRPPGNWHVSCCLLCKEVSKSPSIFADPDHPVAPNEVANTCDGLNAGLVLFVATA